MTTDTIIQHEAPCGARVSLLPTHRTVPMLLTSDVLRGCNVHHAATVIRQEVDLGSLAGVHSDQAGPEFARQFLERFFEMRRLLPDSTMPAGFIERLHSPGGAPLAEVLLEAIVAVDTAMAFYKHHFHPIAFSTVVTTGSPRRVLLVWECKSPGISRRAAQVGLAGCLELLPNKLHPHRRESSENFAAAFADLENRACHGERSTTVAVLALAARKRNLPCETLSGPHLRLGHGASQRLIYASATGNTSLAASQLARNKYRTNRRLAEQQLPIARQIAVTTELEALAAADGLGYPVVIKPLKQKQAIGVSVGIAGPDDIPTAFAQAAQANQRAGQSVIIEEFLRGQAHRLLVVGGRFVAALRTVPSTITGDGSRTIAELVEELNSDPLRNGVRLFKVPVDDHLVHELARCGYGFGDVLEKNQTIALHSAANVAIGGLHHDVTDSVHPDNQEMAIRATRAIGLDIAGVDFVTEDISRSYKDVGGGIIEVNARPGLCMHTWPRYGRSRPAAAAVLELVFPAGASGRIPVAVIAGNRGTARLARDLDAILRASGKSVALATRKHCFINGQAADSGVARKRNPLPHLLRDQRVQTLVGCVSPHHVVERGLGVDMCDVAAIVGRDTDRSTEGVFGQSVHVLARATRGMLVVDARHELAREVLSTLEAKRLVLVGTNSKHPAIAAHAAAGGAVVVRMRKPRQDQDRIVMRREGKTLVSIRVARTEAGSDRISKRRMESRMFAVALAFGMGMPATDIKAGLRSKQ